MNNQLPKLGRPFVSGSPRKETLKFYVSFEELLAFQRAEEHLIFFYSRLGYKYNRSVHFRQLLKYLDDVRILNIVTEELPIDELKKIGVVVPYVPSSFFRI